MMNEEESFGIRIAEVILYSRLTTHLRYPSPYSISGGEERWLGLEMDEDAALRSEIERSLDDSGADGRRSFTLDIYLQLSKESSTPSDVDIRLESQVDGSLKPFQREKILLETWRMELQHEHKSKMQLSSFVRALHCLLRLLPCYRLCRSLRKAGSSNVLITFQFRKLHGGNANEAVSLEESILNEGITEVSSDYTLPEVNVGRVSVQYRTNCRFHVQSRQSIQMQKSPKERAFSFETVPSLQPEQPLLRKVPSINQLPQLPNSISTNNEIPPVERRTSYPPLSVGSSLKKTTLPSRNRSVDLTSVVRSLEMLRYVEHPTMMPGRNRLPAQSHEELRERYKQLKNRNMTRSTSPIQEMEELVEEEIFPFT